VLGAVGCGLASVLCGGLVGHAWDESNLKCFPTNISCKCASCLSIIHFGPVVLFKGTGKADWPHKLMEAHIYIPGLDLQTGLVKRRRLISNGGSGKNRDNQREIMADHSLQIENRAACCPPPFPWALVAYQPSPYCGQSQTMVQCTAQDMAQWYGYLAMSTSGPSEAPARRGRSR
jgi:hypothetical protein